MTDYTVIFPRHWPISSAKPPRGSRHVPVTNCMSRSLTSLSTSFTSCKDETENARKSDSQELNTYSVCICVRACMCVVDETLPARTKWSVCCSWCSVDTLCSSASPEDRPPACHTASPGSHKQRGTKVNFTHLRHTCTTMKYKNNQFTVQKASHIDWPVLINRSISFRGIGIIGHLKLNLIKILWSKIRDIVFWG